jgi:hypothetical protein
MPDQPTAQIDRNLFHEFCDWYRDDAYERGYQDGRTDFAAELLDPLRWLLAGVPCPVDQLHPDELDDVAKLLRGDIKALLARAIRHMEAVDARRKLEGWAA